MRNLSPVRTEQMLFALVLVW